MRWLLPDVVAHSLVILVVLLILLVVSVLYNMITYGTYTIWKKDNIVKTDVCNTISVLYNMIVYVTYTIWKKEIRVKWISVIPSGMIWYTIWQK